MIDFFKINIFRLHPLLCIFSNSILQPKVYSIWLLNFNILNYFGWSCIYFSEKCIEKTIDRSKRKNFIYPVKYNMPRILAVIATLIGLNLICKVIILTTKKQKDQLTNSIVNCGTEEKRIYIMRAFRKKTAFRKALGILFMLLLSIFLNFLMELQTFLKQFLNFLLFFHQAQQKNVLFRFCQRESLHFPLMPKPQREAVLFR